MRLLGKLFLFLSVCCLANAREAEPDLPNLDGVWLIEPEIKVCKSANISESRVKKAVSYWERLGYTFGQVIMNDESAACLGQPWLGDIVIDIPGPDYDWDKLGITYRATYADTGIIMYTIIYIQTSAFYKERVLEHEIGHALGWNHSKTTYHLMHEEWIKGGSISRGLERTRYDQLSNLPSLIPDIP